MTEIAIERRCTPAQLALAWLLHQGPEIVPIPGTRSIGRLEENAGATRLQLGREELRRIDRALTDHAVAGSRYVAAGLATVDAESVARR